MPYSGLTKKALVAELERLLAENRDLSGRADEHERLLHKLHVHQIELEMQNKELREAQIALEESRARYADLYDHAPVAYLTLDDEGIIREINLTGAKMLGQNRRTLIDKPILACVRTPDTSAFWAHFRQCIQTGEPVVSEFFFLTKRAGGINVQLRSVPELNSDGKVTRVRTTLTDVTPLRKAEEERVAREFESRLRARFEAMDHAWLRMSEALAQFPLMGLSAVFSAIVEQACLLAGAQYAAVGVGKDPSQPFDPWVASGMSTSTKTAIGRHPRPVSVLGAVVREDKTIHLRDIREHPAFLGLPPGHPPMTSFIGTPIHDHGHASGTMYVANKLGAEAFSADDVRVMEMLAERAGIALELAQLHELERRERGRLSVLADTGKLLSSTLDQAQLLNALARLAVPWLADCCLVYVVEGDEIRDAGCAHVDPAKQEILADLQRRIRVKRDCGVSLVTKAWQTGRTLLVSRYSFAEAESGITDPSLAQLARNLSATSVIVVPIVVREQTRAVIVLAYTGSSREYGQGDVLQAEEIALRAGLALENARLYREAQAAIRARDNLLAFVSHDLKGPLSAIQLSAGALARPVPGKDYRKPVDVIVRCAERMTRLINDLLDAATIDAGRLTVQTSPEDVAAIVQELVLDLEPLAATKRLSLEMVSDGPLPSVQCDRPRVLQILSNLVGNAIKFAPEGTSITIALSASGEGIHIAVSDLGCGITEQEVPHLFDQYWKGKPSKGSGLGLYIAKGIVDAHGGRIWVETTPGRGSTFHFTLPVAGPAPSSDGTSA